MAWAIKRSFAVLTLPFFAGGWSLAEPAPLALTLDQAVALGLERNADIFLAEQNLDLLNSRYREIVALALPNISASGSYTRNYKKPLAFIENAKLRVGELNGFSATIDAEQIIYAGGSVLSGQKAGRAGVEAGKENLRAVQAQTTFAVKRLYWMVLLASATVSIQEENIASAEEHLRTIQARYKEGVDSDLAVLRQEVEVAGTKPLLIRARNMLEVGLTYLKDVLKIDVDDPVSLVGELASPQEPLPDYERLVRLSLERHPELQAARQLTLTAKNLVGVAQGAMRPHLSLFGGYQWQAQSDDFTLTDDERGDSLAAGLRANLPLFTGGGNLERVRQARIEYEKAQEIESKTERAIRVELKKEWLDAREALERAQSQETAILQARRALEATEARYKAGQEGLLDLNDAAFSLNRARLTHAQALSDYWTSLAAVEKAAGAPLKEISP